MYIPEALKLNRFRDVKCPTNREYFQRNGFVEPSGFTGDEVAPVDGRKLDNISDAELAESERLDVHDV